jgi:hypothetical protein
VNGYKDIKSGRLAYYSEVGWIDWEHTDTTLALDVLDNVRKASAYKPGRIEKAIIDALGGGPEIWTIFEIQEKGNGTLKPMLFNPTVRYRVHNGLTEDQIIRTAFAIFKDYHNILENKQEDWEGFFIPGTNLVVSSTGNSQEDRISDILGFQRAINPELDTQKKLVESGVLGKVLDKNSTIDLLNMLGGDLGSKKNKNRGWLPIDHNKLLGLPEMTFPKEVYKPFKSIRDIKQGTTWERLPERTLFGR